MILEFFLFQDTNLYKWILKYKNKFSIVNRIPVEVVVVEVVVVVGPEVVLVVVVGASVVVIIRQQLLHCQGWTQVFNFYKNIRIRVYGIRDPRTARLWCVDPCTI